MEMNGIIENIFGGIMFVIIFSIIIFTLLNEFSDTAADGPHAEIFSVVGQVTEASFVILLAVPFGLVLIVGWFISSDTGR